MKTIAEIERAHPELTALRRDIHAHPELAFQETRTSTLVAESCAAGAWKSTRAWGKPRVVGILRAGSGKKTVGLRADMDALPMPEHNRFAHRFTISGRMHGCGHDGHTAMLLGGRRSTCPRTATSTAPWCSSSSRPRKAATPARAP